MLELLHEVVSPAGFGKASTGNTICSIVCKYLQEFKILQHFHRKKKKTRAISIREDNNVFGVSQLGK